MNTQIKVTGPSDINVVFDLESAIRQFEAKMKKELAECKYANPTFFHLVISGELNRSTCDEIEKIYKKAGWVDVKCRTSTENGERGGLTGLMLSTK